MQFVPAPKALVPYLRGLVTEPAAFLLKDRSMPVSDRSSHLHFSFITMDQRISPRSLWALIALAIGNIFLMAPGAQSQTLWGGLQPGPHGIGFATELARGYPDDTSLVRLNIWYPAMAATADMTAADYLRLGVIKPMLAEPTEEDMQKEKEMVANLVRRIYDVPWVTQEQVAHALSLPMKAQRNAPRPQGAHPTVIMYSDPYSQSVTAEYLASHGFVVVAPSIYFAPSGQRPDSLLYVRGTRALQWLLERVSSMEYVDPERVAAVGFGGGIQSPFYLTMLTDGIKALVNLDGGVFDPRSKTTLNVDYRPDRMRTPMLNVMTFASSQGEDANEKAALNSAYLHGTLIRNARFRHHDFAIYGRVIHKGILPDNPESRAVDASFVAAHALTVHFLKAMIGGAAFTFGGDYEAQIEQK